MIVFDTLVYGHKANVVVKYNIRYKGEILFF